MLVWSNGGQRHHRVPGLAFCSATGAASGGGSFVTDRDDLATIRRLILDAMPVLFVQSSHGSYPQVIAHGKPLHLGSKSLSMNSMVFHTLASVGRPPT